MSWFKLPKFLRRILNLTDVDGGRITFQVLGQGLEIVVISGWDRIVVNVSAKETDKLGAWINQALALRERPKSNANRLSQVIPISRGKTDPEGSPRSPRT